MMRWLTSVVLLLSVVCCSAQEWIELPPIDEPLQPTTVLKPGDDVYQEVATAEPGDVIALRDGTYAAPIRFFTSGTADQPITLMAMNSGQAVIDGSSQSWASLATATDVSYIRLIGLRFINNPRYAIEIKNGTNWTVQDCRVEGCTRAAVANRDGGNLVISGCEFVDCAFGTHIGIKDGTYVTNVLIEDSTSIGAYLDDGFLVENALTTGVTVRRCRAENAHDAGFDLKPAATVVDCVAIGNSGPGFKVWRSIDMVGCVSSDNAQEAVELNGATGSELRTLTNCQLTGDNYALSAKGAGNVQLSGGTVTGQTYIALDAGYEFSYLGTVFDPPLDAPPVEPEEPTEDAELGAALRTLIEFIANEFAAAFR